MQKVGYDQDLAVWAQQQAQWLRNGQFDLVDVAHVAEEIEDVGKSEQREIVSRLAVLLTHLLKWRFQPGRRGNSWRRTIVAQRKEIRLDLRQTPSLRMLINDPDWWWDVIWSKALAKVTEETGLESFPEVCPWSLADIVDSDDLPEA
jgi:hypothetical protein